MQPLVSNAFHNPTSNEIGKYVVFDFSILFPICANDNFPSLFVDGLN